MKLQKIDFKIRCDTLGCGNLAKYALYLSNSNAERVFLCNECLAELREAVKAEDKKI